MRNEQGMHLGDRAGNMFGTPRGATLWSAWSRVKEVVGLSDLGPL